SASGGSEGGARFGFTGLAIDNSLFFRWQLCDMAGQQTPASALLDKCVGELKFRIERLFTGGPLRVRLASDDCGVSVNAHFHVVVLEHFVFRIFSLCFVDIVCPRRYLAG